MNILIKDVLLDGKATNIFIKDNVINKISDDIQDKNESDSTVINGTGKAVLPAFYNLHTHAGMSILKGYGDDKELFKWLSEDIWPLEDKFTSDTIYHATRLAILEMIKTGTVGFSDMYFNDMQNVIMQAADEMGVRANVSLVETDLFNDEIKSRKIKDTQAFIDLAIPCPDRIKKRISIHSVYTCSTELMEYGVKTAKENNLGLHIHLAETEKEVSDCIAKYGKTPVQLLEEIGALSDTTVLAHSVHLNDDDLKILKHHNCILCTCPVSNLKLCSGMFKFQDIINKDLRITLGTDGSASNNNLSMIDEMKCLALVAKIQSMNPVVGAAEEVFKTATVNGAKALGFNAGEIKEGNLADLLLVDLNNPLLVPDYNLISNMVYAADSSVIDTVICNGKILMQDRYVQGEEEIIANARETARKLKK